MVLIKKLLIEAGCEHLVGPNGWRSAGGLLSTLKEKPNHIAFLDEFGDEIAGLKGKRNPVQVDLWASIRTLFSSTGGTFLPPAYSREGKAGKTTDDYAVIESPALTILGLTTKAQLMSALTSAEVENGTINRFLFNVNEEPRIKPLMAQLLKARIPAPLDLMTWAMSAGGVQEVTVAEEVDDKGNKHTTEVARSRMVPTNPVDVRYDGAASELIDQWPDLEPTDELYARFNENAHRIMVILAVSCDPVEPVITTEHVRWAFIYLEHLYNRFSETFGSNHANTEHEAKVNFAMSILLKVRAGQRDKKEGGAFGISQSRWRLRMRRYPRREQTEIIAQMLEGGMVVYGKDPSVKKSNNRFYAMEFVADGFVSSGKMTSSDEG